MEKFLIVEWLDNQPIIDGANYYDTHEDAMKRCVSLYEKSGNILAINVRYTVCRIFLGKQLL